MEVRSMKEPGGNRKLTVTFDPEAVRLVPTPFGTMVEMADAPPVGEPGGPALPGRILRVALPQRAVVDAVAAEVLDRTVLTKEPVFPAPMQRAQPGLPAKKPGGKGGGKGGGSEGGGNRPDDAQPEMPLRPSSTRLRQEDLGEPIAPPRFTPPRAELYKAEHEQPRPFARLVATEQVGLTPIAVIQVNPVRLDDAGRLVLATRLEIEVRTRSLEQAEEEGDGGAGLRMARPINSRAQAARLVELGRMIVVNPDDIWDFSPIFPDLVTNVDYLVITDDQRWDATSITPIGPTSGDPIAEFERLAEWKERRGLRTRVVTVSEIVDGAYGDFVTGARDLQEVIRRFARHAYNRWGVAWLLLGGDLDIVPTRRVPGASEGHIDVETNDPPERNRSFWTGTFLKMNVQSPGTWFPGTNSTDLILVRPDTGLLIPFDATNSSGPANRGWYFTTDGTGATRSAAPTQWIRVNGPAAEVNARLQWIYHWNHIPTDLYYASLVGPTYGVPGARDWDLIDNGLYGQHTDSVDLDGVDYQADISVGRAPVTTEAQARAFVDKVIAYERFQAPDGTALTDSWTRKMLIVSANWGGRKGIGPTNADPPRDDRFHHPAGAPHTLIKLKDAFDGMDWRLLAEVAATDVRVMPYDRAASSGRGWHYAKSATDLSPSEIAIPLPWMPTIHIPIPTQWAVVYGPSAELTPTRFIFDHIGADGSLRDQEELRELVETQMPQINDIARLYEDEVDLTPAQQAAGPVQHLTGDRLRNALDAGPHLVSLSGHGNADGCCGLSRPMADALANGPHAFIAYADSCLTNQFDADDAVSEHMLYNPSGGAVAYIGNSRFSWIGVGDNFQRGFFQRLTTTRHLGLLNDTRCGMVNESTGFWRLYNKWQILSLNLMGDPEMPVWLGPPRAMKVAFPAEIDTRVSFQVTVTRRLAFFDLPLPGVAVHVRQGSLTRSATTDGAGRASFDLSAAHLGPVEVTATRTGYRPFLGSAEVVGPAWVHGRVELVSHRHGGANASYVRLRLSPAIDGDAVRGWYARPTLPDYAPILDAATDAYISDRSISFLVASIREGGTIERFRFGSPFVVQIAPDRARELETALPTERLELAGAVDAGAPDMAGSGENGAVAEAGSGSGAEAAEVPADEPAGEPSVTVGGVRATTRVLPEIDADALLPPRTRRRRVDDPNLGPLGVQPQTRVEARVAGEEPTEY